MTIDQKIASLYKPGKTTLRSVALIVGRSNGFVRRSLERSQVEVVRAKRSPFTVDHRLAISRSCMGRKCWASGKKMPAQSLYKNMAAHIRFRVEWEWLSQFEDIEKLKTLNRMICPRSGRFQMTHEAYKAYLLKFYHDESFNRIYQIWVENGKCRYLRPSIDHIHPKAKGGMCDISNWQVLTWFENRCKNDMGAGDWLSIKSKISLYIS